MDKRLQARLAESPLRAALCRPLLSISCLVLLFCALTLSLPCGVRLFLWALCALFALCLLPLLSRRRAAFLCALYLLLAFLVLLFGEVAFYAREEHPTRVLAEALSDGAEHVAVGTVTEENEQDCVLLSLESLDGRRQGGRLCCVSASDGAFACGGRFLVHVRAEGAALELSEAVGVSPETVLESPETERGFARAVLTGPPEALSARDGLFDTLRAKIVGALESVSTGDLIRAAVLADRSALSEGVYEIFSRTGAMHVLAMSGLHLGILIGVLFVLGRLCFVNRRVLSAIVLVLGAGLLGLSGAPLSLLRAYGMLFFSQLAVIFRVRLSAVASLALGVSCVVLWDRAALTDAGLLLSVCATLSILLMCPPLLRRLSCCRLFSEKQPLPVRLILRPLRYLISLFFVSLAAVIGTLPVSCLCFGEASLLSPLLGLVQLPLFSVFLTLAFFVCLLAPFAGGSVLFSVTAALADLVGEAFLCLSLRLSRAVDGVVVLPRQAAVLASVVLALFLAFCLWYRVRALVPFAALPLFLSVAFLCVSLLSPLTASPRALLLHSPYESHLFLQTESSRVLVANVTASASTDVSLWRRVAAREGVAQIDELVLLSLDGKDATRAAFLSSVTRPCRVWVPAQTEPDLLEALALALRGTGAALCAYDRSGQLQLADSTLSFFAPSSPLVCRVEFCAQSALLLSAGGDGAAEPQADLLFYLGGTPQGAPSDACVYAAGATGGAHVDSNRCRVAEYRPHEGEGTLRVLFE